MRRGKFQLVALSVAVALPLVVAIHIKSVKGSEPPGRLVVSADGLAVTDAVTGLLWQRGTTPSGSNPSLACTTLSLEGISSGWRLPTVKELLSLVDYESATSPMVDTAAFPGTSGSTSSYWTSNSGPYAVNFGDGVIQNTNGNAYRCVSSTLADGGIP